MTVMLSPLINPLATVQQLELSSSSLHGLPRPLEDSVRFETSRLIQTAGMLLRMPQDIIAQAIVLVCRYWTGHERANMLKADARDVAAAALYLAIKPSGHTVTPRLLLTVFQYLAVIAPNYDMELNGNANQTSWHLSEGDYERQRTQLYALEAKILSTLGYNIHVALPYTVCINYMQALDVFKTSTGAALARRTFEHLNSALFSPQVLYLTYQPSALATAAIYISAREIGVQLPAVEWWEVFDVEREDLGFLVVALQSVEGFVDEENKKSSQRRSLLTSKSLTAEIDLLSADVQQLVG